MGIPENLYACAVCEKSFPIAKSLVDHVNKSHVKSLPSKIEHKKETETKVKPKKETKVEHKKENKTKIEHKKEYNTKIEPKKETKIEHKKENHTKFEPKKETKIEHKKENKTLAPASNDQQTNCDMKVGATERKNNQEFQCNYCNKCFNLKHTLLEEKKGLSNYS